jgi:hypothetical protein
MTLHGSTTLYARLPLHEDWQRLSKYKTYLQISPAAGWPDVRVTAGVLQGPLVGPPDQQHNNQHLGTEKRKQVCSNLC